MDQERNKKIKYKKEGERGRGKNMIIKNKQTNKKQSKTSFKKNFGRKVLKTIVYMVVCVCVYI